MQPQTALNSWAVAKRQFLVIGCCLLLFVLVLGILYFKDRQREWRLREEQAAHRLELAFELVTRDLQRVKSDILLLAHQKVVRRFDLANSRSSDDVKAEFENFLKFKQTYQQIRLLDLAGKETVRVDLQGSETKVVSVTELQDKKDRYYFQQSIRLRTGELFVSEFDLNQEHGLIEQPPNPVIRFATPVKGDGEDIQYLLVANYRGAPLLDELAAISLPGKTYLVRGDGQYLLGPTNNDAWGWLLGHSHSFNEQFREAWALRDAAKGECILTPTGGFAFRTIQMQDFGEVQNANGNSENKLLIVSHTQPTEIFSYSNQLLKRLLALAAIALLPLFLITRSWAISSARRMAQNKMIAESETKLRELSSRLVKIQEDERRAISREIHDQLGQQVTAINLDLKMAERQTESLKVREQVQRAIHEGEHLLKTLHDFASRVRPVELDDLGLHDAVESHIWDFKARTGVESVFESAVADVDLPNGVAENVYRLIQESLNNVLKHANATNVLVAVKFEDDTRQRLKVVIKDDGVGAPDNGNNADGSSNGKSRLGILGMRERVELMGGVFQLSSKANQGTEVDIRIPLDSANRSHCSNDPEQP